MAATEIDDKLHEEAADGDVEGHELLGEVEPDTGDDEEDGDDAEPERTMSDAAQEKAIEKEMTRHEKAMARILGDGFADMAPCQTCYSMGFVPSEAPVFDPDFEKCDVCKGFGFRLMPTNAEGKGAMPCAACQGNGYRAKAMPAPPPTALAPILRYIDPTTGLEVPPPVGATPTAPTSSWAPGFEPVPQPIPTPYPQS